MDTSSSSPPPPLHHYLVRGPEGFSIWASLPFGNNNAQQPRMVFEAPACSSAAFSPRHGNLFFTLNSSNSTLNLYRTATSTSNSCTFVRSFDLPGIAAAVFSPKGTFLQTFQKASQSQEKNLLLWKIDESLGDAAPVYQQFQKTISKTTWPSIRFSDDELVACRMGTNEIQFFDTADFSKGVAYKLRVPGIAAMEMSVSPGSHVAAFIPESKGIPASLQIFSCNKELQTQPVARRSFFRCSSVQLLWNNGSTGLLAVAQSDVDKTNQSYYGESKLNYITTDGSHEGLVVLSKEGPVHDVQWSPSGSEFAVVYGFMPAKVTVFDKKGRPLVELGTGPYNTLKWNPMGKYLCVAGFGNLPGDMAFWDCSEKKLLGSTKAECSVTCEWSPNGHYLMTATTAPRLQIDNCIKIFSFNGMLHYKKTYEKLYQAEWKPEVVDLRICIDELTRHVKDNLNIINPVKTTGSKPSQVRQEASNIPAKPAAYRPPHAKTSASVQAELFGGADANEEMSKAASRNKKKREKQREKKAAEAASSAGA